MQPVLDKMNARMPKWFRRKQSENTLNNIYQRKSTERYDIISFTFSLIFSSIDQLPNTRLTRYKNVAVKNLHSSMDLDNLPTQNGPRREKLERNSIFSKL